MLTTLFVFSLSFILIVYFVDYRRQVSAAGFLLANREISGWPGAFSIAASWIWAPALFVSTQVGYQWGPAGLFWFVIPNMFALIIFSPLAKIVKNKIPNGCSFIDYLKAYDPQSQSCFFIAHLLIQLMSFAMQITAGSMLIASYTGLSFSAIALFMIATPLIYSYYSGLSSSIRTDTLQYLLIIIGIVIIAFASFPLLTQHFSKIVPVDFNVINPAMLASL